MSGNDDLAARAQARLGSVLRGKYRLDHVLGIGGMAVVYKATHRNQAEFAVKMLHPELSARDDVRTRFLREGYAANSVKHSGVVLVVDDDVAEDGAAFLVMELLGGAVLESLWERCGHRLPVAAVLSVADQLLDVLAAAHAKGIVHRDIKPANLFATRDGTLKVLDFGIARVKDAAAQGGSGQATGTGILLGTPAFMAPEQAYAKASEIDGQTDVWAVGATLFTLLTGQPVHEGENSAQLMIHAATTRARPLASLVSDVPPAVAQVIDCALAFEKASRWSSAAAMREAMEGASIATFGESPSKSALAELVTVDDLGHAPTLLGQAVAGSVARSGRMTPPSAARTPCGTTPSGPSLGSTAQPVSSEHEPALPLRSGRDRRAIAIASAVVILAGGAIAVRAALGSRQEPPAAATAAPTVAPRGAAEPAGPESDRRASPSSAVGTTITPNVADGGAVSVTDLPVAPAPVHPAAPAPVTRRPALVPSAPTRAPAAVPPATNCNPPTWTDEAGHVHLKRGCE